MPKRPARRKPPSTETDEEIISLPNETFQDRLTNQIVMMQRIMEQVLDLRFSPVTPSQLRDAAEMFICQMHLKKVVPEWFFEHIPKPVRLITLCTRVAAEGALYQHDLPDGVKKLLADQIEQTQKEINEVRVAMLPDVKLLGEIPLPGVKLH